MLRKFKTLTVFYVSHAEIENLIEEVYGKRYEILPDENWNSDDDHLLKIVARRDDWGIIEDWLAGKRTHYMIYALMDDLCDRGCIPEGAYLLGEYA